MKKTTLSVSVLLLIVIIAVSAYFIWNNNNSKQTDNTAPVLTPTEAPTPTTAPSPTPLPEQTDKNQGLYPAYTVSGDTTKYGYIDGTGAFVIQPVYDYAYDFSEGFATVTEGDKYLVIDTTGGVIFENDNTIAPFHQGMAAFYHNTGENMLYGYIDTTGQVVIEPQFNTAGSFHEDGKAYVALPDGKTFESIDQTGAVLETHELNLGNSYITDFEEGFVVYNNSDTFKFGVTSMTGEPVLEAKYSDISYLGNGLFAVKSPDRESYEASLAPAALYNAKGEQLSEYQYYDLQKFHGNYTSASDDTSLFFIDKSGKEVSSLPSYEGGGSITLFGDVVKGEIDGDLIYYRTDNTVLWQNDNTIHFDSGITVKQMKFKPLRTVLVHYPQVEGLSDATVQQQINEQLETTFTESRSNITAEDQLTVDDNYSAALSNHLLTIAMTGYDYYAGAAHGMPLSEYYFIDTSTGEFYEFKDLFKKDSDYQSKINEIIKAKIEEAMKSEDSMYFEGAFTGITDSQHFYLTEDSLVIYFYPYDIAAYAAGFPEFAIPFTDLTDVIDKEGAFWKSFQAGN